MPISPSQKHFRRILAGRMSLGLLLAGLVLSAVACASVDHSLSSASSALAPQQQKTPTILITSMPAPTTVNLQPPTFTAIPTVVLDKPQAPLANEAAPTASPMLPPPTPSPTVATSTVTPISTVTPTSTATTMAATPTFTATLIAEAAPYAVFDIGQSSRGFPLTAYQFNNGPQHIVIVGGIHGGYEWNTILLAYQAIDYFLDHPATVPETVTLTIIPSANPDGQELVTGKTGPFSLADLSADTVLGRFNGNNVDLNRNWDCQWAPSAFWRGKQVSGGERPFSEPETIVLRDYFLQQQPDAVIFLHSAANGVFASGCPNIHQPSMDLASIYGAAAGYPVYERFSAYEVTGDAGDWLTTQGITSISVELRNHENLDFEKNISGILAVLEQVK